MSSARKLAYIFGLVATSLIAIPMLSPPGVAADDGAEKIAVVGLDQNNQPVEKLIAKSEYIRHLSGIVTSLHESTAQVLTNRDVKSGWFLRHVAVGFSLGFEAGIGPVLTLGGISEFLLVYTNKAEATIP